MKRETIENILNFLKEKEGKELPQKWKLIHELENHPDGTQYRYDGMLDLSNTNITKLPNDLHVDGVLDLRNCQDLTKLPNKLFVSRSLYMEGCEQLTKLPDNLHIGGSLSLEGSKITELPNNLYVGDDLYVYNTPLANKYTDEEIREIITSKGGAIIGGIYTT